MLAVMRTPNCCSVYVRLAAEDLTELAEQAVHRARQSDRAGSGSMKPASRRRSRAQPAV